MINGWPVTGFLRRSNGVPFRRVPTLNHLWQRFLLTSSLLVGLAVGVAATVFGYSNLNTVDIHWSVFQIRGIPLWAVAVVPVTLTLVAGTLYHWVDGLHHFTEHMRHRHRVKELEAQLASMKARLDQVLEMPDHAALPEKKKATIAVPAADEAMDGLDSVEPTVAPASEEAKPNGKGRSRKRTSLTVDALTNETETVAETEPEPTASSSGA